MSSSFNYVHENSSNVPGQSSNLNFFSVLLTIDFYTSKLVSPNIHSASERKLQVNSWSN